MIAKITSIAVSVLCLGIVPVAAQESHTHSIEPKRSNLSICSFRHLTKILNKSKSKIELTLPLIQNDVQSSIITADDLLSRPLLISSNDSLILIRQNNNDTRLKCSIDNGPTVLFKSMCIKGPRQIGLNQLFSTSMQLSNQKKALLNLMIDAESNATLTNSVGMSFKNLTIKEAEKLLGKSIQIKNSAYTHYFLLETIENKIAQLYVAPNRSNYIYAFKIHIDGVGETYGNIENMNW